MRTETLSPSIETVDPAAAWSRPTRNVASRLTRIAALAEAELDQMFATVEDENLSADSPIGMAIELGLALREEITELRRLVAAEEKALQAGRVQS